MLTSSSIIHLPFTTDLTEGGIAYALRSLSYAYFKSDLSPVGKLRRTVANVAVELAFRRYLANQNVAFEVKASRAFTDSERYDVFLDKYRCGIKSFFISNRNQISEIKRNPQALLNAQALVPADHHAADGHSYNDIYIFAFATGLIAASQVDLQKALDKNQPHYLVHILPESWRKPSHWNPLGTLTLKSESDEETIVEVIGQDEGRVMKRKVISLHPKTKINLDENFYAINAIHVKHMPNARIGIKCEAQRDAYIISHFDWANIWVYGMDIFLCGFLSYEEFSQQAKALPINSKTFQYETTRVKNLFVPVANLKPMEKLFINRPAG
ncbi:MAG: hypothetical protein UZ14_CFX002001587 [Chloroflexi bacterium OLB14]|nr:MAG: hypothetical protein UZ14_CFX002001587 [Chloroflexi bacterium OLB14]